MRTDISNSLVIKEMLEKDSALYYDLAKESLLLFLEKTRPANINGTQNQPAAVPTLDFFFFLG